MFRVTIPSASALPVPSHNNPTWLNAYFVTPTKYGYEKDGFDYGTHAEYVRWVDRYGLDANGMANGFGGRPSKR